MAVDGVAGTEEDTTVLIDVLANDTLGLPNESDENVALLGLGSADPGSVASTGNGADTRVRYVPDAANSGTDDFTYDVCQETEGEPGERCDTATVTITVLPADEPNPPSEPECTARGTKGADKTRGTPKRDVICGFRGDDTIYGMGSNDVIVGNSGSDTIQGETGYGTIYGGRGADTIQGGCGNDRLYGDDVIQGGSGRDTIQGGAGDNLTQQ